MSRRWCGKSKPLHLFRIEDKIMLKLNNFALCALALLLIALTAQTETPAMAQTGTANEHNAQVAAIEQVMKQYHEAVVNHNGAGLSGLFLPDANIWLNVLTDSTYDRAKAKTPTTQKVRVGNYRDFSKFVSTTTKSLDPEHSNVVIHTDGTIAAVYFDFVFKTDGTATNTGSETWQLVKTADGWRIAAICYSSDPPVQ
jgi:ketosteroid isomerase-like protein